ncbi:hypothetical protein [Neogemmobacter tilapiae]|uniref:Uncharacterized protein n=1 Tax=Neogemmobacter tilapiae TaxID=875041 RepID=A0A918TN85_9RHOB|nr:hypothetical protein [Gemmobacter tilapiae]GHC55821.1 hypothetical protein GCM10007315_18760 [Gemmobacter tilapiae]
MRFWLYGLALLCGSALQAQELVDYDALFRDHAEQVVKSTDGKSEHLELQNGVTVSRYANGIVATDSSEGGAVGCALMITGELLNIARQCRPAETQLQAGLEQNFMRVLRFAAENAYPPQDPAPLIKFYEQSFNRAMDPKSCAEIQSDEGILAMMNAFSDPLATESIVKMPRLPVSNPCL